MVLGKLPVPGRPTILITVGQGPIALAVGAGGGCLDIFTLIYHFSSFSLSLGDGSILTEISSQRAVKPKTTNQPIVCCMYTRHNAEALLNKRCFNEVTSKQRRFTPAQTLYYNKHFTKSHHKTVHKYLRVCRVL